MVKSVTDGNGTTHFFDVVDGTTTVGQSMLFIPLAVSLVEQVPMLVYYHGHNSQQSIEGYINAMPQRDFRPSLKDKKVLLVEPWGGTRSKFGKVGTVAGTGKLIANAMFIAISNGPPTRPCPVTPPSPPSLILAGFSGGGATLKDVGMSASGSWASLLTEVWCFDCFYSEEGSQWAAWARANPSKKLRVRLSDGESSGSPRAQGAIVQASTKGGANANIDIAGTVHSGHEDLPGKFISTWL